MYCYRATMQTKKGDALIGWQIECVQNANLTTPVTIYADESSTPILSVSGVANRAVSDDNGNFYFFVEDGVYGLRYYDSTGAYQRTDRYVTMYGALSGDTGSSKVGFKQSGTGAVARTVQDKMRETVSVKDFGAVGDGATDDRAAIVAAIAAAASLGGIVYFPTGTYFCSSQVDFGRVGFRGDGETQTVVSTLYNGSLFKITVNATLQGLHCSGLSFVNNIGPGGIYASSCAIEIAGDSTGFLQYGSIENIATNGFYTGIKVTKGTRTTSFGLESNFNWFRFSGLTFNGGNNAGKYGIWFTAGSGTGHTSSDMKGSVGTGDPDAAYIRYGGNGCVVGDILTGTCHAGGPANFILITDDVVYLENIAVGGNQYDASTSKPIRIDNAGKTLKGLSLRGGSKGGSMSLAAGIAGFVRQPTIDDLQASVWRAGNDKNSTVTGEQTLDLFTVSLDVYNCTSVSLSVGGLIGGIGSAIIKQEFLIQRATGVPTVVALTPDYVTTAGASTGGSSITLTTVASGAGVTFKATFTSSGNSQIEAQMAAVGGSIKVARL